jgi:hypothetical protein
LLRAGGEILSEEENATMSTKPAAQSSVSGPDPNRAAASPTPVRNVADFREDPAGAVGEPKHAAAEAGTSVSSRTWQLATLLIPILLTTWLTFWASRTEDRIKQDIDKQSQLFTQQLQLSEELYKRRFDSYEKLYAQLVQLNGRLQTQGGAERGDWSKINADQVIQFNESLELSKLHMSPKVENLTGQAWLAGARGDGPLLSQRISELEVAMKTELDNWMLEEKGAQAADSNAAKPKKAKLQTRSTQ